MAVVYKPHKSAKTLLIGGQSVTTSTDGGLVGPFPTFSINREDISTGDGTYIGTKFSIEITGTATLNVNDEQDITAAGSRQNAVMGAALTALQFDRDSFPTQGTGSLEISPYGGKENIIRFSDARLLSISLPEQTEEEAGVQYLQYTFSFEAYKDASDNNSNGSTGTPANTTYKLSSAEESWELSENDQKFFQSNDPTQNVYKTYTLTHTVSATGLKKYNSSNIATDGEAWRQAQKWVKTRLKSPSEVRNPITTDLMNDSEYWSTTFIPVNMDGGTREAITPDLRSGSVGYKGYNHVRSVSSDLGAGSYSVTETWVLCDQSTVKATHDIEVSIEDDKSQLVSVSISATIQGLNSNAADSNTQDSYANAKLAYETIKSKTYSLATAAYAAFGASGTLRNKRITESYGENKISGTITYSVSYNDDEISLPNAISENLTVNYDNTEGLNQVTAKIPIIGKEDGPVIQKMNTTTIKTVSVTFDAVMEKGYRSSPPTAAAGTAVDEYKPDGGIQQSKTESWSPKTGSYNLQISWEYI